MPAPSRVLLTATVLATFAAASSCAPAAAPRKVPARGADSWVSGGPTPVTPGTSATAPAAPPPKPRERWEPFAKLANLRTALTRAPSQHFAGAHDGEVLANEVAADYPALGPRRTLPAGAMLVETLRVRGRDDVVGHLVMTKRPPGSDAAAGDWEYAIVTAAGEVEARGSLAACVRCHAEAPHDRLFGPPLR
jgi:hypothetical protein